MNVRSFTKSLFYSVGGCFVLLAAFFIVYQYHRERMYKIDVMQGRLQMYNYELMQSLGDSLLNPDAFGRYVATHDIEGLRVTVIDTAGRVRMDSRRADVSGMSNHLNREEIRKALKQGNGYDIKRNSETLNTTYFYSATYFPDRQLLVRTAVPYDTKLAHSLEADNRYILYVVGITLLLGLVLFRNTARVGRHIRYLRNFAMKAERGESPDEELQTALPNDELGEISRTITVLYWKLKHSEEDKVRLKRQLTQNVAHELKTPAAGIQGYLETILQNPDMAEDKRNYFLQRCYAQSCRMSNLLNDMSTLARLDDARSYRMDEVVNLREVADKVVDDFCFQLEEKQLKATVDIPADAVVTGNASMVDGIFRNIVGNALMYAAGATELRVTCTEEAGCYRLRVSDNGPGVAREHLPHLFERFYRVDKGRSRENGGTGLGLAIVKNAVLLHGGEVRAEATSGGGLTIAFTLPKRRAGE